jgi:hypothetical protein
MCSFLVVTYTDIAREKDLQILSITIYLHVLYRNLELGFGKESFWERNEVTFYSNGHTVMSSHDSIGIVLKCMLKGAADFLVKSVRKNELRNLWQHVWRRHTICFYLLTFPLLIFWICYVSLLYYSIEITCKCNLVQSLQVLISWSANQVDFLCQSFFFFFF